MSNKKEGRGDRQKKRRERTQYGVYTAYRKLFLAILYSSRGT